MADERKTKSMPTYELVRDKICVCCGKTFFVPVQTRGGGRIEWVYKIRNAKSGKKIMVCSYSCMRKHQITA